MKKSFVSIATVMLMRSTVLFAADNFVPPIPDDFPRFIIPGNEVQMESLRELYYLHYLPGGPLATLWDEWLSGSTLWPALETDDRMNSIRDRWAKALSGREMDAEGYVATHQHASIAHQQGWPFPSWEQGGSESWGWHFAVPSPIYAGGSIKPRGNEGWELVGATDAGINAEGWNITLDQPNAILRTPSLDFDSFNAPYLQLRWKATGLTSAEPKVKWKVTDESSADQSSELYFDSALDDQGLVFTMIPVYKSSAWRGRIARLEIHFENAAHASVTIQSFFTQYDTRHTINQQNFVRGSCQYFWWTRDLSFLRANIQRMRLAVHYAMTELGGRREKCITVDWVGHDGRSGIEIGADGTKRLLRGRGVGGNYWDLMPFGGRDAYATIHYFDMLNHLARLESEIAEHPEWNIPGGPLAFDAAELRAHAKEVKEFAGYLFWNKTTGRFVSAVDADGKAHDYGYTFVNFEAIAYGFATDAQSDSIMKWIEGSRAVEGDTAQGADIYQWRFAPRASTRRNIEYYFWGWSAPESIPFGGQIQDGGAVLGFSYHDLMARLETRGPDDAWKRLQEIIRWFDEVLAVGGYREFYKDPARGTLQGGGTAGGLGLDHEFFESILVPQVMLSGFMGLRPGADAISLNPRLPTDWPELTITRIHYQNQILDITARKDSLTIHRTRGADQGLTIKIGGTTHTILPNEIEAVIEIN